MSRPVGDDAHTSFWYEEYRGELTCKLVTGDFPADADGAREAFTPAARPILERLPTEPEKPADFSAAAIQNLYKPLSKELGAKAGALVLATRVALTGSKVGPSLYHLMEVLGKERVLNRLRKALTVEFH